MTITTRAALAALSEYSESFINKFNYLPVELRTPRDLFGPPSAADTPKTRKTPKTPETIQAVDEPIASAPPPLTLPPTPNVATLGLKNHPVSTSVGTIKAIVYSVIYSKPNATLKIIPSSVQKHITKTVRRKDKEHRRLKKASDKSANKK